MLSEERIRTMTALAVFESDGGERKMKIAGYFKHDYVCLQLIGTIIWVIIGYAILLLGYAVIHFDELLEGITIESIVELAKKAGIGLAAVLILYIIIGGFVYARVHRNAVRDVKEYYAGLRRLDRMYRSGSRNQGLNRTLVDWEETEK